MSDSSQSSSNSMSSPDSNCSEQSSCYLTANSGDFETEFSPFDDTIEPLASAEEIAQYEDSIAREEELENTLQARFEGRVNVSSMAYSLNIHFVFLPESICY